MTRKSMLPSGYSVRISLSSIININEGIGGRSIDKQQYLHTCKMQRMTYLRCLERLVNVANDGDTPALLPASWMALRACLQYTITVASLRLSLLDEVLFLMNLNR